jgi:hypothetical protein
MAENLGKWPSKRGPITKIRADYQNHALGWLQRGYHSLGGRKVVRFPRIWMSYGECRFKPLRAIAWGRSGGDLRAVVLALVGADIPGAEVNDSVRSVQ